MLFTELCFPARPKTLFTIISPATASLNRLRAAVIRNLKTVLRQKIQHGIQATILQRYIRLGAHCRFCMIGYAQSG